MKKVISTMILTIIIGLVAYGIYNKTKGDDKVKTEATKLIDMNLEKEYPEQPKDVATLFCRITRQFYDKKVSEKQIAALANQMRNLYSKELLENNPYNEYIEKLNNEIKEYKANGKIIIGYSVDKVLKTDTAVVDNVEHSIVRIAFDMVSNNTSNDGVIYEELLFVKENDRWKIKGWRAGEVFR